MIGRPMTKAVVPALIASAGVITRFWSPAAAQRGRMPGVTTKNSGCNGREQFQSDLEAPHMRSKAFHEKFGLVQTVHIQSYDNPVLCFYKLPPFVLSVFVSISIQLLMILISPPFKIIISFYSIYKNLSIEAGNVHTHMAVSVPSF